MAETTLDAAKLVELAPAVAARTSTSEPLAHLAAQQASSSSSGDLDQHFLDQAPNFLALHSALSSSSSQLAALDGFLRTFASDLGAVSHHIAALQTRSNDLERRLAARRRLEAPLGDLVEKASLSPEAVVAILDGEPSKEWAKHLAELERVLNATSGVGPDASSGAGGGEAKALDEARQIAEGCRVVAAGKLRPYLLSPLAPIKRHLSANLALLQSVLLTTQRPLYSFLARHAPRVAIDVQREYVGRARLYFETGFRRYTRALAGARDRARKREGGGLIGEIVKSTGDSTPDSSASARSAVPGQEVAHDSWTGDASRLSHALIEDGPAVVLAYQAEDVNYRAPVEALFRSLSLVLLDNASSEYAFIARFFEDLGSPPPKPLGTSSRGGSSRGAGGANFAPASRSERILEEADEDGPAPEESASAAGDVEGDEGEGEEALGTVVSLSESEQRAMQGRAAADELWRQIMEPVLGHWNTFAKSLLSPPPQLLPLLTMIRLNDALLATASQRGAGRVLQPTLQAFKMQAYPLLQRAFGEHVDSVKRLADGEAPSTAGGAESAFGLGGLGSLVRAATGGSSPKELDTHVKTVCARYARLYSSVVQLSATADDAMLFGSLLRMRAEVERLITTHAARITKQSGAEGGAARASYFKAAAYEAVKQGLETGPSVISHARLQSEMSHWSELERARRAS